MTKYRQTRKRKQKGGAWYNPLSWGQSQNINGPKKSWGEWFSGTSNNVIQTADNAVGSAANFISTGAQNDLERITRIAYGMVTLYGMNPVIGNVSFNDPNGEYQFQRPYSEETARMIDVEVRKLINEVYERTRALLLEKREQLELIAQELLNKEVIYQTDLERLVGPRPYPTHHFHIDPIASTKQIENAEKVETEAAENTNSENTSL